MPKHSTKLAEFFGIMLGDGHISKYQIMVCLGTKEEDYVRYVQKLLESLFSVEAKVIHNKKGYWTTYLGSADAVDWALREGLVGNKVKYQVGVPSWIFSKKVYMEAFLRGFFDTDGSVYKLRFGIQISFCNHSLPILHALHEMLCKLQYKPSKVGSWSVYITRRSDVERFFKEAKPSNVKHVERYRRFVYLTN